jgi:hypothetical protein
MDSEPKGCGLVDDDSRTPKTGNQSSTLILSNSNNDITSSYIEVRNPKPISPATVRATVAVCLLQPTGPCLVQADT